MKEINPFIKISWSSEETRRKWASYLPSIAKITANSEYALVKKGIRAANIFCMHPQSFDREIEKITMDGLVFLPMLRSKSYVGFSHKHNPVKAIDSNALIYGVIARKLETAQNFVNLSNENNHIAIGQLLGYPNCCSEAFQQYWGNREIFDPCYEIAQCTPGAITSGTCVHVGVNPLINPLLRYFGIKVIPFFPCSYECPQAVKIAEVWFNELKSLDVEIASVIKKFMEQSMTWSLNKGIIFVKNPIFRGVVNGYECKIKKEIFANC